MTKQNMKKIVHQNKKVFPDILELNDKGVEDCYIRDDKPIREATFRSTSDKDNLEYANTKCNDLQAQYKDLDWVKKTFNPVTTNFNHVEDKPAFYDQVGGLQNENLKMNVDLDMNNFTGEIATPVKPLNVFDDYLRRKTSVKRGKFEFIDVDNNLADVVADLTYVGNNTYIKITKYKKFTTIEFR